MNWFVHKRWLRRMELGFLLAGVCCAVFCVFVALEAASTRTASKNLSAQEAAVSAHENKSATVMGRLDIPALEISVPILSDYENTSLLRGVGHIPGTAMPGGLGTLGLAGHRDTYFRPLAKIKPKMDIRVIDGNGTYHYSVDATEIVKPEDVGVLDIRSRPELTLITCYPFYYVGAAPLRFVVHAHLLSALADPAP